MSEVLRVENLCKEYPKFRLSDVSFSIESGSIMGLIGRNGAGKTTTIKSLLNLVHPSSGSISFFGMPLSGNEAEIKKRIGYAGGAVDYYRKKRISSIVETTRRFYPTWNDDEYRKYMNLFCLDEDKTPSELSEGMKVKLNLTLALSHGAQLLILDEPTSGLDPVSRDELLEVFRYLVSQGISILFSTHITSDLDKCADSITYIRNGRIEASERMDSYVDRCRNQGLGENLEQIMIHFEKEALHERLAVQGN